MTERGTAGGPRRLAASLLVDAGASLGEAPLWDAVDGSLVWVDILAGIVHVMSPSGETRASFTLGHTVGSAMPADGGGWLLADAMGYGLLSREGHRAALLDLLADRPELRFNDAKCDPLGRAWAGTIESAMAPGTGTLYRLDPGPVATPVLRGLTVSNGIGWSPDGHTMWFADSADRTIRGFDYGLEDGRLGVPSRGIRLQDTSGKADGLCVDDEGFVWVGLWSGWAVHRYAPDGRLDTIVDVPASQVTSCAFGGRDRATLFITTARAGLTGDALRLEPHAGGLFVVEPGVTGPAATPWRGDLVVARRRHNGTGSSASEGQGS
jgi:sugar lactone lactonase YvrE